MSDRTCGECGRTIYYGLYCSNDCADRSYARWCEAREAERTECRMCDEPTDRDGDLCDVCRLEVNADALRDRAELGV